MVPRKANQESVELGTMVPLLVLRRLLRPHRNLFVRREGVSATVLGVTFLTDSGSQDAIRG